MKITIENPVNLDFFKAQVFCGFVHAIFVGEKESICLCSDGDSAYDLRYIPLNNIVILDDNISNFWTIKSSKRKYEHYPLSSYSQNYVLYFGPKGWDDDDFLFKLLEPDEKLELYFFEHHNKIAREFPDKSLKYGTIMNEQFAECPYCSNAVVLKDKTGVLTCDDCEQMFSLER